MQTRPVSPRRPPAPFPERGAAGPPPGGSISDAAAGRTAPGELPRGVRDGVLPGQRPIPAAQETEGGGSPLPPPPISAGPAKRFAPRNWRVRTRLVVLVIVPLVATIFGAAARIVQQVGSVQTYDHAKTMAAAASPLNNLIDGLQDERDISIEMMAFRAQQNADSPALTNLSNLTNLATSMATQRKVTDRATAAMLPVLNKIDGSYPADTLAAIANAKANMTGVEALHTAVDGPNSNPLSVFDPRPLPETSIPGWPPLWNGNRAAPVYVVPGTNRALFGAWKSKYHQSVLVVTLSCTALLYAGFPEYGTDRPNDADGP